MNVRRVRESEAIVVETRPGHTWFRLSSDRWQAWIGVWCESNGEWTGAWAWEEDLHRSAAGSLCRMGRVRRFRNGFPNLRTCWVNLFSRPDRLSVGYSWLVPTPGVAGRLPSAERLAMGFSRLRKSDRVVARVRR